MDSKMPDIKELQDLRVDSLGKCNVPTTLKKSPNHYVSDEDKILVYATKREAARFFGSKEEPPMFEAAGPRKDLFFGPCNLTCGIVTCGGLCPGLNDVIRTIVLSLKWQYGVKTVLGFRYGYEGLSSNARIKPMDMTPEVVEGIQNEGGTILGSSRGPQDPKDIVDTLLRNDVKILFAIGGDGTFKGAHAIVQEIKKRKLDIAVIGVPKTIDNDIYCCEKTFGFSTAVEKARESIYSAHEEAKAAWNGIGLVKLMGRDSGFIAARSTLADSDVNFCFIPEYPFALEGENGFLAKLKKRLGKRGHAVIVIAEGAGQNLISKNGVLKKDESGNVLHSDIGIFLREQIKEYLKKEKMEFSIKYIDPSYTIRSCPANADDSIFCLMLAQNAVHAGMAGKTDMFVGYWNHQFIHVPLKVALNKRKQVDVDGALWQIVREITTEVEHACYSSQ